jgi:hypothetical protein
MIAGFAAAPEKCRELGAAARAYIETEAPSWGEIVAEDLLPVWRAAAATRRVGNARR